MGGKKMGGMGAQKVKKDFAEIEREAEMADQVRSKEAEETVTKKQPEKDEETVAASMRLAYQEIGAQQKKTVSPPCAQLVLVFDSIRFDEVAINSSPIVLELLHCSPLPSRLCSRRSATSL
jgi:hypothetical protein